MKQSKTKPNRKGKAMCSENFKKSMDMVETAKVHIRELLEDRETLLKLCDAMRVKANEEMENSLADRQAICDLCALMRKQAEDIAFTVDTLAELAIEEETARASVAGEALDANGLPICDAPLLETATSLVPHA